MMLHIPQSFQQRILHNNGEQGRTWLAQLPELVAKYLRLWDLRADGIFTDLTFNFVMPVLCNDETPAILKLGPHTKGLFREAMTLSSYDGRGAARLLRFSAEEGVLLIERIQPGLSLQSALTNKSMTDAQATLAAAQIIAQLLQNPKSPTPNNQSPLSTWGLGFEKFLRENCRNLPFPVTKVEKADSMFKELVRTTTTDSILHGDLHHRNILQTKEGKWIAIDPKGLCGDPAFEIGAFMRNPFPELSEGDHIQEILRERLSIFKKVLRFDENRMWAWAYSQCVLAAIWSTQEKTTDWQRWLQIADAMEDCAP